MNDLIGSSPVAGPLVLRCVPVSRVYLYDTPSAGNVTDRRQPPAGILTCLPKACAGLSRSSSVTYRRRGVSTEVTPRTRARSGLTATPHPAVHTS